MSIFNRNKDSKTTSKTSKAEYEIVIKEKFGIGTTTLKKITAKREIDPDDHVVYLANLAENFLELFPQDENDFEQLDAKEITTGLAKAKLDWKKEQTKTDTIVNKQNYLYKIMKLEAKKRALMYNRESPYMTINESGVKTFYYLREGSIFYHSV